MGSSGILNKHGSTGYVEIGDTHKFDTSIDGDLAEYGCYATIFSKLIGQELFHGSSTDIYLWCRADFTSNTVGTEGPNFMHLGIPDFNTLE